MREMLLKRLEEIAKQVDGKQIVRMAPETPSPYQSIQNKK
jgi:hypothetical protein